MKEICTLLVKLHIIFSRMQRVNQHARPSIIQVGCPTCCYQVCALDHANVGTADPDYRSGHCHRNGCRLCRYVLMETKVICHGDRALSAMVLIKVSWNIPVSATKRIIKLSDNDTSSTNGSHACSGVHLISNFSIVLQV